MRERSGMHADRASFSQPSAVKATVGYVLALLKCSGIGSVLDGAAVLSHSIHLSSARTSSSLSAYNYKLYAFAPKSSSADAFAPACSKALRGLGYMVIHRPLPVEQSEIRGAFLRNHIMKHSCCGISELLKLHAYTLVKHPIVVLLEPDMLVLKPLDVLFDAMLARPETEAGELARSRIEIESGTGLPQGKIDAFFVRDYANPLAHPGQRRLGIQGGFLVLRPSQSDYDRYVEVYREGNFSGTGGIERRTGWGGLGDGGFYGDMQFRGVVAHFYDNLFPGRAVELNGCVYNVQAARVRHNQTKLKHAPRDVGGACTGARRECEDCRYTPLESVKLAHFTACGMPWMCPVPKGPSMLCPELHGKWHRVREELEATWHDAHEQLLNPSRMAARSKRREIRESRHAIFKSGSNVSARVRRKYCMNRTAAGYLPVQFPAIGLMISALGFAVGEPA